ncbi:glycosyltransferase family 2 protein [Dinghuibacter silviterrae]|uniref:Glycosyltransferase involved in cell wall biosynthesis n=1 Tax=Dinghuibacter silviterrae TaxID=1539049 RepID=A0A4R8DU09_9BACT|nr:glycosyltransferase family 2 protein [Dinghuibacter silviterrae]TDX01832.1 glycosyltransferase involved in cell wall biosynthesis [Dinghuibacter silviterrae]
MQEVLDQLRGVSSLPPVTKDIAKNGSEIKKLSIIIPAYNEEKTIGQVLEKIRQARLIQHVEKEIIVVDDCSTDQTAVIVNDFMLAYPKIDIKYNRQSKNQGKGAAIHRGIALSSGDCLLIQDADLEYDPSDYNQLLKPFLLGHADVVYGSRFMGGNAHRILFFWHSIGNRFLTFLSNAFSNLNLTDMETGYKVFRTNMIQGLPLHEKRFGFEPEVTARIARIPSIRIYEVGIAYYGRTYKEGKKIKWVDGVRTIYCIIKYGIFLRKQIPVRAYKEIPENISTQL